MNFYYASLIINSVSTVTIIGLNYVMDRYLKEEDKSVGEALVFGFVGVSALLITTGIFRRCSRETNRSASEEMQTFTSDRTVNTRNPYDHLYDPGRCLG